MDRRKFIKSGIQASVAFSGLPYISTVAFANLDQANFINEIDLTASPTSYQLLEGNETKLFSFQGKIINGCSNLLKKASSYLGPTIEVNKGDRLRVNFKNMLPEASIIHWHGLHLPEDQDGHPRYSIESGDSYTYDFRVTNRAGLYWYHPHPHGRTGYQVYHGLAGLFIVRDKEEISLGLPSDQNELFFVYQDRHFDNDNQLIYVQSGHDIMMGKMGDQLFVNGSKSKERAVNKEAYRLRLLNGSNARSYRLQWQDGRKIVVIGTDGGLLSHPVEKDSLLFSPGERIDIFVDFSEDGMGDSIALQSIPIVGNGSPFDMSIFKIEKEGTKKFTLPSKLSEYEWIPPSEAINLSNPKVFKLAPKQGVGWTIDNLEYEMNIVREKETVELNTTEIWEFDLTNAGMIHPMHIHGSQFQVLERVHGPFSKNLVFDDGWKDTVAVLPGDRVRIIKRFNDFAGTFLFHCHILEHEDHSMMRNFLIK